MVVADFVGSFFGWIVVKLGFGLGKEVIPLSQE
jgi:hypothetical protein